MTARVVARLLCLTVAFGFPAASTADGHALSGTVRTAGRAIKDVVVWLESVPAAPGAPRRVVLDQRNLTFTPHVLAVQVGTTVRMPNNDRVYHNVFSFKDGKRFDLGLYPVGQSKMVTFDASGVSRIFCNIHPNMAAYVVAVDSRHFAVSDTAGSFTIADVPPGTYTYHAWRAGRPPASGTLVVEDGRRAEIELP